MEVKKYNIQEKMWYGDYLTIKNVAYLTKGGKTVRKWECIDKIGKFHLLKPYQIVKDIPQWHKDMIIIPREQLSGNQSGTRKEIFREYIENAKKRDIIFSLSLVEFDSLISQNCAYCGQEPVVNPRWNKRLNKSQPSLSINGVDRIDSSLGYELSNSVSCCPKCNLMKNVMSKSVFFSHIEKIYNFNKEGSTTIL